MRLTLAPSPRWSRSPISGGAERRLAFLTFEIEIPDKLAIPSSRGPAARLPATSPAPLTWALGTEWQRGGSSAALVVPSVLVPQEYCVLLNPEHPDSDKILVSYPEPFAFDSRL